MAASNSLRWASLSQPLVAAIKWACEQKSGGFAWIRRFSKDVDCCLLMLSRRSNDERAACEMPDVSLCAPCTSSDVRRAREPMPSWASHRNERATRRRQTRKSCNLSASSDHRLVFCSSELVQDVPHAQVSCLPAVLKVGPSCSSQTQASWRGNRAVPSPSRRQSRGELA